MDDPLGYAFVVEVRDLLAQNKIFKQGRAAVSGAQRVLIV